MAAGRQDDSGTLPLDSASASRLVATALPFGGAAASDVACQPLAPAQGTAPAPIALGTMLWRSGGPLRLTVIVRASFAMFDGARMAPVEPDPFRTGDAYFKNRPLAHVVGASDRVPWKAGVDVTLLGHARAPRGRRVPETTARLALHQGGQVAFDKSVRVVGDRAAPDAVPHPFEAMPIVYERARGGQDAPANPIGTSEGDGEQPNVLDPKNPLRPAGFGPLAAAWHIRSQRLGDLPKAALDERVVDLPRGFDWSFFQAAPADQVVTQLAPDAVLVLDGFHAEHPRLEVALPAAHAVGAVYGLDAANPDAPTALAFRADTLHVDADRWTVSPTWRACVDVRDEAQLARLLVVAGVGVAGTAPAIPAARPELVARAASKTTHDRAAQPFSPGATLDPRSDRGRITLPFGEGSPRLVLDAPTPSVALAPAAPKVEAPKAMAVEPKKGSPWAEPPPPAPRPPPPAPEKRPARKIDVLSKLYGKKS